jgi:hypothetical protein
MGGARASRAISRLRSLFGITLGTGGLAAFLAGGAVPVLAANPSVPWECSTYQEEAQIRCMTTFIELQRDKIAKLEGELHAQQGTIAQLKGQVERQVAATASLERQLSERPPATLFPPPYTYVYSYPYPFPSLYPPGIGLGLYFGRPWGFGPFFYSYPPHWGFRFHRPWGYRR